VAKFYPKVFGEFDEAPKGQENRVARVLSGRRQPGSGSSPYAKGDVIQKSSEGHSLSKFLVECKQTKHKSLSVKGEWLSKISREAMAAGKEPALQFEIKGIEDTFAERDWIAIPLSVFKRLLEQEQS